MQLQKCHICHSMQASMRGLLKILHNTHGIWFGLRGVWCVYYILYAYTDRYRGYRNDLCVGQTDRQAGSKKGKEKEPALNAPCFLSAYGSKDFFCLSLAFSPGTLGHPHILPEHSFKWSPYSLTHLAPFWERKNSEEVILREGGGKSVRRISTVPYGFLDQ